LEQRRQRRKKKRQKRQGERKNSRFHHNQNSSGSSVEFVGGAADCASSLESSISNSLSSLSSGPSWYVRPPRHTAPQPPLHQPPTTAASETASKTYSSKDEKTTVTATARLAEAGALVAASWATSWDRDIVKSALSSTEHVAETASNSVVASKKRQTKSGGLRGRRQSPKSFTSARRKKTAEAEASSDSDQAGLVFDFASPPNSNNTKAVYNNAKEFMKSSATIQDFRRQNSYEKRSSTAKLQDTVYYSSKTLEWPLSNCDTAILCSSVAPLCPRSTVVIPLIPCNSNQGTSTSHHTSLAIIQSNNTTTSESNGLVIVGNSVHAMSSIPSAAASEVVNKTSSPEQHDPQKKEVFSSQDLVKIVNNSNQVKVNKISKQEEFATEQSKTSDKLIEPNECGALVVTKQTKKTTNSNSEITAKTEEQQAKTTGSKANVIVVSRGANEGDPPLWTIVNNSTPMNSAVNVITGTRITHGHPLLIGSPPHTTSEMVEIPWTSSTTSTAAASVVASNYTESADQMSQPPVIHSSTGTSSTRTSVLQRQCSLGGAAVVGHAGGVGRGEVAAVGLHGDRDQSEVEPVVAHDASLSCISTNVPVLQSKPPSLLMTSSARTSNSTSKGGRGVLKRAMTLPVDQDDPTPSANSRPSLIQLGPQFSYVPLRSPMRTSKPLVPNSETSETLLDIPILITTSDKDDGEDDAKEMEEIKPSASSMPTVRGRSKTMPASGSSPPTFEIPTFTVTINPLESDEMTFVPGSPPAVSGENQPLLSGGQNNSTSGGNNQTGNSNKFSTGNGNSMMSNRSIANMTVIVDDEVTTNNGNNTTNNGNNPTAQLLLLNNGQDDDELRRCSIGSASSLQNENRCGQLGLPDLGIRRVSEISHINELRRGISGMEHLTTEFYEISREPNPDCISLDSIHKRVLKRCQNKYIPPQRSSSTNKCFVVITTGFTIMGILYTFWYKNFGPGSHETH